MSSEKRDRLANAPRWLELIERVHAGRGRMPCPRIQSGEYVINQQRSSMHSVTGRGPEDARWFEQSGQTISSAQANAMSHYGLWMRMRFRKTRQTPDLHCCFGLYTIHCPMPNKALSLCIARRLRPNTVHVASSGIVELTRKQSQLL